MKVALSHLQWQRDKILHSETPLHLKLGSTLMEVVGAAFHRKPEQLLSRPLMVKALLSQHKRATVSAMVVVSLCLPTLLRTSFQDGYHFDVDVVML